MLGCAAVSETKRESIGSAPDNTWTWVAIGVAALGFVGGAGFVVKGLLESGVPAPMPPSVPVPVVSATPHERSLAEELEASDLNAALVLLRPVMTSVSTEPSTGAELLAQWATQRLTWSQLKTVGSTSYAKAMKDPELERGHRLCVTDLRVVQIVADRQWRSPVYRGLLGFESGSMMSFVAVLSTGDIVEGSRASFCGIVTGAREFPNVSGGFTQTVHTVGMFDLPENRD